MGTGTGRRLLKLNYVNEHFAFFAECFLYVRNDEKLSNEAERNCDNKLKVRYKK